MISCLRLDFLVEWFSVMLTCLSSWLISERSWSPALCYSWNSSIFWTMSSFVNGTEPIFGLSSFFKVFENWNMLDSDLPLEDAGRIVYLLVKRRELVLLFRESFPVPFRVLSAYSLRISFSAPSFMNSMGPTMSRLRTTFMTWPMSSLGVMCTGDRFLLGFGRVMSPDPPNCANPRAYEWTF